MNRRILGTGDHIYEVVHPFGSLPAGITMGNTSHVATDSRDRVYVYQRQDPPVLVFNGDGNFLTSWGSGELLDAHGVYISGDDEVYLVDRDAHEVVKFDVTGDSTLRIGQRGKPALQAPFNHPADIAVAPGGDIFVADGYGDSSVHRFGSDGRHRLSWGSPGSGPGQFTTPHGIWVDPSERVYVCDRENNRVQVFSLTGEYLTEWGDFYHPMDIFQDGQGVFYVTDQIPRITMLNADGEIITRGRTPYNGHGLWLDSQGNIYLAGNDTGITKLVKLGT